jgi:hypothetical protein
MTPAKDTEAAARAKVVEAAAKVAEILAQIQATLDKARETDGGKGAA